jgi:uncharacterized protein (TIGR02452 family)
VSREAFRAIAQETVAITDRGHYTVAGTVVDIRTAVRRAIDGTRLHQPGEPLRSPEPVSDPPVVEVTTETTLAASRRLVAADRNPAALVFASARHPGGGFLTGAQAQEESIARSSALHACQLAAAEFHRQRRTERSLLYTDRVIHSPAVPVFRDDDGTLRLDPYEVALLTAAAPNRAAIAREQPAQLPEVAATLGRRARRVLAVAAAHGHRSLVLGAWGCGVFGNDPAAVAAVFRTALAESPWFTHVVFAVPDPRPGGPNQRAFAAAFDLG